MEFLRRWWWLLLLLIAIALWAAFCRGGGDPRLGTTRLEIESHGGFAYIPDRPNHRLEIVYLADLNLPECTVDQIGTQLLIEDGNIVEVLGGPTPGDKIFKLDGAVVTFPDLESSNLPLTATRGNRPVSGPPNPSNPANWTDLKWVAGIGPDFPQSTRNPNWRDLPVVDGRMVLRGGEMRGHQPSDLAVRDGVFDFKRGSTTAFTQGMTDRTHYTVQVPGDRVVMQLTGADSGITRIVVEPRNPGQPVRLELQGLHTSSTATTLPVGTPVTHYCAFYQLLDPIPPSSAWLIPHYAGNPAAAANVGGGQPSPGAFCPGQWGPE